MFDGILGPTVAPVASPSSAAPVRPRTPGVDHLAGVPMRQQAASPVLATDLSTHVPGLGPYPMRGGGAYELLVYPGPLMRTVAQPASGGGSGLGTVLDETA